MNDDALGSSSLFVIECTPPTSHGDIHWAECVCVCVCVGYITAMFIAVIDLVCTSCSELVVVRQVGVVAIYVKASSS
jgi:hypothetical protein